MTLFQSCFQMACYTRPVPMFAALTAIITALCVSGRSEGLQTAGMMIIFLAAGFAARKLTMQKFRETPLAQRLAETSLEDARASDMGEAFAQFDRDPPSP